MKFHIEHHALALYWEMRSCKSSTDNKHNWQNSDMTLTRLMEIQTVSEDDALLILAFAWGRRLISPNRTLDGSKDENIKNLEFTYLFGTPGSVGGQAEEDRNQHFRYLCEAMPELFTELCPSYEILKQKGHSFHGKL